MNEYRVIGLMSGSSLDGLDIAYCHFSVSANRWSFEILKADTVPFTDEWVQDIKYLPVTSAKNFSQAHAALGAYFGKLVSAFIAEHRLQGKVDFVASHGHTIFHFPDKRFTAQIGDGAALAVQCGLPVVCDFRTTDVALGGQGTPIVPIGDKLLFPDYRLCLNIGGIANISCKTANNIVAFDISPANQVLNLFASKLGMPYDVDGNAAKSGALNQALLERLNGVAFYHQSYPKSLDNSFTRETILPRFEEFDITAEDKLRTYTEHIATQVATHIKLITQKENITVSVSDKLLLTGGGAFNKFLVERIQALSEVEVVVPSAEIVQFKEALVIALMGVLRMRNEVNVLASVTGAAGDSVGGSVYGA
ncbi:MAG: anhydro-N-acetylmuramic acid kinase [Chitinophagales bacterium]|nr:anhydro-N-acetylmuramic acid kinase [Chitinophagales bacterium]